MRCLLHTVTALTLVMGTSSTRAGDSVVTTKKGSERLNVIVFLADDLGQRDLGCYGSDFYETPNIDRLAEKGVRFTDAYAACPVCSPSRAALLTGKAPARIGLTSHVGDAGPDRWSRPTPLLPAKSIDRLPLEERTLGEAFHDNGYATMHAGKWHLGHEPFYPEYHGFDVNQGGWSQGGPFTGKGYFSPYGNPRLTDGPPGEHLTARLAEEASRFIKAHREEPFFIHMAWYAVHAPLQAPADLVKKYEDKLRTMGREPGALRTTPDGTEPEAQNHAIYAAMVESLDRGVGRVMQAVLQAGIAERTVVLFTSDNGGLSTGDVGLPANQGWPTSNAPLRAGKGWLYEGGVRVPLIVAGPTARKHAVSERIVAGTDFYTTALSLAGINEQEPTPADSVDFSQALQGDVEQRQPVFWHYPHYGNQGGRPGSAVRDGDWKLIEWHGATPHEAEVELFNLASDPGEQTNLADKETTRRDNLLGKLNEWRREVRAAFPEPNKDAATEQSRAAVSHRLPVDR